MSVGKILLLLVNLKYLIILIIYFHLQNLCSSKSVSRHLLIIILIFFQRGGELGGESWGMGSVLINYFSEEISLESHPWFSYTGAQKGLECRCVGMHREGWAGLSLPSKSPPFPQRISGMWTGDVMGPVP